MYEYVYELHCVCIYYISKFTIPRIIIIQKYLKTSFTLTNKTMFVVWRYEDCKMITGSLESFKTNNTIKIYVLS